MWLSHIQKEYEEFITLEVNSMFKRRQLRRREVSKLVAGPRVYIYDECVMVASRIMEDHSKDDTRPQVTESSVWRTLLGRARQLFGGG